MNTTTMETAVQIEDKVKLPLNRFIPSDNGSFTIAFFASGYTLQFTICLLGNILELIIIPRIKQPDDYMSYALLTLAFSDILHAFTTMPYRFIRAIYVDWFLGQFLCKFSIFLIAANSFNGIWIAVYIAFDRYINICHPLRFMHLKTKKFCIFILSLIFIFHFLLSAYHLHFYQLSYAKANHCIVCTRKMSSTMKTCHLIIVTIIYRFILPIILLFFFYGFSLHPISHFVSFQQFFLYKQEQQHQFEAKSFNIYLVKILLLLLILFTLTYFPIFLMRIASLMEWKDLLNFTHYAYFIQTINCAVNPLLYSFYSKQFRDEVYKLFVPNVNNINKEKTTEITPYANNLDESSASMDNNKESGYLLLLNNIIEKN